MADPNQPQNNNAEPQPEGPVQFLEDRLNERLGALHDQLLDLMQREQEAPGLRREVATLEQQRSDYARIAAGTNKINVTKFEHANCLREFLERQPGWRGRVTVRADKFRDQDRLMAQVAEIVREFPDAMLLP